MALKEILAADDWKDIIIPTLSGGLNNFLDPDNLENTELSRAENVRVSGDKVIDPFGYSKYHGGVAVLGTPMDVISFEAQAGTKTSLLVTTLSLFIDIGTQWKLVPTIVVDTIDENETTGATVINIADTTSFVAGNPVSIELDSGAFHHSTISSISAGVSITIAVGIPSAASIGNDVQQGYKFTGDTDDIFSMVSIPWSDQVAITNNKDQVQVFTNSSGTIASLTNPAGVTTLLCKVLAVYDSSLWLLNITENGTPYTQRVRACDKADITEWVTGVAYSSDLFESTKPITSASKLGPYLIIYRERGIHRVSLATDPSKRFEIFQMLSSQGVAGIGSVVNLHQNQQMFWGIDNFYTYQGGFDATPVGDKIKHLVFGETGESDPDADHKRRLLHLEDFDEVLCVYQGVGDTEPVRAVLFKNEEDRWTYRKFAHPVRGASKVSSDVSITWQTAIGTWNSQSETWQSAFLGTNAAVLVFASDTYTYSVNPSVSDDDGTAITRYVETKDFSESPNKGRIDFIEVKIAGGSINVDYSTNEGISWQSYGVIAAAATEALYRIYKQFIYESLRFRFSSSVSGFRLYNMKMRVTIESEV